LGKSICFLTKRILVIVLFKCTLPPQFNAAPEVKEGLSQGGFRGSNALLFELEDKVAQAAASVQSTCTQVREHLDTKSN